MELADEQLETLEQPPPQSTEQIHQIQDKHQEKRFEQNQYVPHKLIEEKGEMNQEFQVNGEEVKEREQEDYKNNQEITVQDRIDQGQAEERQEEKEQEEEKQEEEGQDADGYNGEEEGQYNENEQNQNEQQEQEGEYPENDGNTDPDQQYVDMEAQEEDNHNQAQHQNQERPINHVVELGDQQPEQAEEQQYIQKIHNLQGGQHQLQEEMKHDDHEDVREEGPPVAHIQQIQKVEMNQHSYKSQQINKVDKHPHAEPPLQETYLIHKNSIPTEQPQQHKLQQIREIPPQQPPKYYQPHPIVTISEDKTEPKNIHQHKLLQAAEPKMVSQASNTIPAIVAVPVVSPPVADVIQESQIQFQILLPDAEFIKPIDLKLMISSAYHQRRQANTRYFFRYIHNRNMLYLKQTSVLDDITEALLLKINRSSRFLQSTISYFSQLSQAYRQLYKQSQKITIIDYFSQPANIKTKNRYSWSKELSNGTKQLLLTSQNITARARTFEYYLATTTKESLQKLNKGYNAEAKRVGKLTIAAKNQYCDYQNKVIKDIVKLHKIFKEKIGQHDVLKKQMSLLEELAESKKLLRQWGTAQLQWWKHCLENEIVVANKFREIMIAYLQASGDLHNINATVQASINFWMDQNIQQQIQFEFRPERLLSVISVDFVKNSLCLLLNHKNNSQVTFESLQVWNNLENEEKVTGKRSFLVESAVIRRFDCQMLREGSWIHIVAVSTIDEGLILFTQRVIEESESPHYRLIRRMNIKNLNNTRKDGITVNLNQKQKGLIFDKWNKEVIRFKQEDIAQEFMFLTENQSNMKREYLV